jgi:hypothetical protein
LLQDLGRRHPAGGVAMDVTQIGVIALGIGFSALGWFARELWSAVQALKTEVKNLEVKIGTDYVRYDRLQDALRPIKEALDEIKTSLRDKADKP